MAVLSINYRSEVLERNITFTAVVPDGWKQDRTESYKTVYLLHGYYGDQQDWLRHTHVEAFAEANGYALILPAGENSFYIDHRWGFPYGRFIGEELIRITRSLLPLSGRREDTVIAGLSMGGYGALRNGLHYDQVFGRIGAFSSVILTKNPLIVSASEKRHEGVAGLLLGGGSIGDLPEEIDLLALVQKRARQNDFPPLFLACGTEDYLFEENEQLHVHLAEKQIGHRYITGPGSHDWAYWTALLPHFFDWLTQTDPTDQKKKDPA